MNLNKILTFFDTCLEISSSGKSRVNEIQISLLPAQRFNCVNFAETVCWGHYQDVVYNKFSGDIFERCFADGSRDYGSRLVTVPEHPQVSNLSFSLHNLIIEDANKLAAVFKIYSTSIGPFHRCKCGER